MIMFLLSLYDRRAEEYRPPICVRSLPVGIRDFSQAVQSEQLQIVQQYPEDFALVQIGTFDDLTGLISVVPVQVVIEAGEVLRRLPREGGVPNGIQE